MSAARQSTAVRLQLDIEVQTMADNNAKRPNLTAMLAQMQETEKKRKQTVQIQKPESQSVGTAKQSSLTAMLAQMQETEKKRKQKRVDQIKASLKQTAQPETAGQGDGSGELVSDTDYGIGFLKPAQELMQNNGIRYRTKAMEQTEKYIAEKVAREHLKALMDEAQKEYDDYLASDEYKAGQQSRMQQYLEKHRWDGLVAGLGGGSTVPSAASVQELTDPRAEELKAKAEHYKNLAEQEANQKVMDAALAELESWSDEDKRNLADYVAQRSNTQIANMFGAQQFDTYNLNPIVQKYGIDKVRQMAEVFERQQNEDMAKQVEETSRAAVDGGFWNGAGHSAASVGANLIGSMTALPGRVLELQNRTGQFPTLQKYTPYDMPSLYAGTVRGQVAENISGDQYDVLGNKVSDGGALRQGIATVYEAGMSAADNLARIFVTGSNEVLSLGLAATGSFGQTVSQMSAQGANPAQAVAMGILSGGLEVITEKVSLDNLFKQAAAGPKNLWAAIGGALKAGGIEVSEEELNFLCSTVLETAILRGKSAYNLQVQQLMMEGGKTYEEAVATADATMLAEAANTAVQSFLSGNISSGIMQGKAAYLTGKLGRNLEKIVDEEGVQALIDSAMENGDEKLRQKIEAGEMPSSYELARLYQEQAAAEKAGRGKTAVIADDRAEEKKQPAAEENPVQEHEKVRISDSGTAMLASPVGVENTREQLQEAKRVAAEYGVDIYLYTESDTDRESYVEDGDIYINTESETPFEAIVQSYVHEQTQLEETQADPAAPAVIQNDQNVIEEARNAPQQEKNDTAAPVGVPEQIRQNQNLNGGNIYETDAADSTAPDAGAGVLHGSSQRHDSARAGEQTGSMAGSTGGTAQGQAVIDQRRATIDRRNRIGSLRLPKVSSAELGLKTGTEAKNIQLVPQEHWDKEMGQLAERIYQETGKNVSYVMGKIQIRGKDGRVRNVKGVITGDSIIVQADNLRFSMEQIADHEAYHGKVSYFDNRLNQEIRQHILEKFSAEEFQNVVTKYVEAMQGIYSAEELQSGEAFEQLMNQIQEEIFADAYAGINAFGAGADRFTSAVNEKMEQLGLGRFRSEENGVRETNGPPSDATGQKESTADYGGERYSIDERFENMIDSWDGKTIGFSFVVGETSDALQKAGIPKKQIRWDASKIKTLLEKHNGMTIETIKQIPELLEHPIIVIDSKKGANSKIVMGDLYDEHGKIVTAVLLLTPTSKKGNVLDIVKISSAEGRSHIKSLFTAEDGTPIPVRYVDKKRIQSWLNVNRLQLPLHNLDSDSKMIIDDPGDGVKEKFSLDDIDESYLDAVEHGDMETAQRLVDEAAKAAGYTVRGFHGSGERFNTFSYGHIGSATGVGILGKGFYFGDDKGLAKMYGSQMYDSYLRMENTYHATEEDQYKINTAELAEKGYDSVDLVIGGGNGKIYCVFDNTQIKSADPVTYDDDGNVIHLSERFDLENQDIRYSVDDDSEDTEAVTQPDFERVRAEVKGTQKQREEEFLRKKLSDEDYEAYRKWERQKNLDDKQAARKRQRELSRERRKEIQAAKKNAPKPAEKSKPTDAKRELRGAVMDLFSIPSGERAELGRVIDNFADRLIRKERITEDDRRAFFDRMYEAGVMTVPADDYFQMGRELVKDGKVYVPESVRVDFGDDWNGFRAKAFGAGIVITYDKNAAAGIDSWNHELARELPGMFDEDETDLRTILERIVDVAEEGRDEMMSLTDYTAMLADRGDITEDEFLDKMERDLDEALRTFAKQANLEVRLKDRSKYQLAREREVHKEVQRRQQERKQLRDMQKRTQKTLQWLKKNRRRAPEELKKEFDEVLGDLDLYAIHAANSAQWSEKYNATYGDIVAVYDKAKAEDPNFFESAELERYAARLRGAKLADLSIDDLEALYRLAIGLQTTMQNRDKVLQDERDRRFKEVFEDSKNEIENSGGKPTTNIIKKLFNDAQLTPMNVFQRMVGWNPNSEFYSMMKQLEEGERAMRAHQVKAQRILETFMKEHEDYVKRADGQGKDGIWYEVEIPQLISLEVGKPPQFGANVTVQMTSAQKVHLYLESRHQDNLRHMAGGRTFVDKELYQSGDRKQAFTSGTTVKMAPETVKLLVQDLTDEEMELARLLDQYYNTMAPQEINAVSNVLYGYDKAMGGSYAPIFTNSNFNAMEFGVFDTTAEGVGSLKERQKYAKNPSYNISCFEAFERNVEQTARFVGMAIPVRNVKTLINFRGKDTSMQAVISSKWRTEALDYIENVTNALQGQTAAKQEEQSKKTVVDRWVEKLQSQYISSTFGFNWSIVGKQLGSIPLASAYLDWKNMPSAKQIHNTDKNLINKYTQDLAWRTMGYSMPETKQLKDNPNWTQTNKVYSFTFGGGAITAVDGWAAKVLWPWAENKVRRDFPDLDMGTKTQIENGESPFYKKVAELFNDALARSQSTSDEIHQSAMRKSDRMVAKAVTMFRSDSAQTYNALRQKIGEAQYYDQETKKREESLAKRTGEATDLEMAALKELRENRRKAKQAVGNAVMAMAMNAMWSEVVTFAWALMRHKHKRYKDDEGELTAESVAEEMVSGMIGSMAGIVAGGEEVITGIGSMLTGEQWYGVESLGLERLNALGESLISAGGLFRGVITDWIQVLRNGGDGVQFWKENWRDALGGLKELAETVAVYASVPVNNVEAVLLGAVKWICPELGAAYDDLWQNIDKGDLTGLAGGALEGRIRRILSDRSISENDETAKTLAALYEAGHKKAVPGKVPSSVTIDGATHELDTVMQNTYSKAWSNVVAESLDELVSSDDFRSAEHEVREKMLSYLYTYAGEMAKAQMFEGYEPKEHAGRFTEMTERGVGDELAHDVQMEMYKLDAADASDVEYWRLAVNFANIEETQMAIMGSSMDDDQFEKLVMAQKLDVSPDMFVTYYEKRGEHDADKNGSYSNAEVQAVIDAMGKDYTKEQKGVLWQMATGSKSTKNNPYSKSAGQKWLDAKAAGKEKEE